MTKESSTNTRMFSKAAIQVVIPPNHFPSLSIQRENGTNIQKVSDFKSFPSDIQKTFKDLCKQLEIENLKTKVKIIFFELLKVSRED